jgi:hypothetical protein
MRGAMKLIPENRHKRLTPLLESLFDLALLFASMLLIFGQ